MRGYAPSVGRILREAISENPDRAVLEEAMARTDASALVEAARYHRVTGFLHRALQDVDGLDPNAYARLERLHRQGLVAHLHVLATLRRVRDALEAIASSWLAVKGPVLAELAYRRPGLRLYQDLDLVIPRAWFVDALALLEADGFVLVDRNWELLRRLMIGELVLAAPGGPEVDAHWDVRYDRELRREIPLSTEELVERGRVVTVHGVEVRTFDATDTLLFLALHATKQGGDKLVWLKDLERSIANDPPHWDDVVQRSRASGIGLFVGSMLLRARRTARAIVPDDVLADLLQTRAWRATLSAFDRGFPPERSDGFGTPATLIVRSTRADVRSTLRTAAVGLGRRGRRLVATGAARRDQAQDDPDDPASRAFPTGPPDARERYLEEMLREP